MSVNAPLSLYYILYIEVIHFWSVYIQVMPSTFLLSTFRVDSIQQDHFRMEKRKENRETKSKLCTCTSFFPSVSLKQNARKIEIPADLGKYNKENETNKKSVCRNK